MPSIKLTDQLEFNVDAEINPDSTIAKYIKSLTSLKFPELDLNSLKDSRSIRRAQKIPATNDALWTEMSSQGQANFGFIDQLRTLSADKLADIRSDYSVIKWWAESMKEMSEILAEMRRFLEEHPDIDPENKTFQAIRKKLASKLKNVASKSKRQFGDPWGLVAMDQVSGKRASARVFITGSSLALFRER